MCLRRAPEKYIAGAALDRAALYIHAPIRLHDVVLKQAQQQVLAL
jgi:hypothetical protein